MKEPISKALVESEIERLGGLAFSTLHFPRELEIAFELATRSSRCKRLWLEGMLAILFFDLLLLFDYWFLHEHSARQLFVRLSLITLVALPINMSMRLCPGELYRESSVALFACLAVGSEFLLQSHRDPLHWVYAQFIAAVILVFINAVMRIRFDYALVSSLLIAGGDALFARENFGVPLSCRILGFSLAVSATILTLIANYSSNREERRNYLLCLRGDLLNQGLTEANTKLTQLAEHDGLTAIPNRYAFNNKFDQLWRQATQDGHLLSVILVDIDHFKRINDYYGHLFGDEVLKRVARLLIESLRKKEDFAARFGGEEFIVLLPNTPCQAAVLVAERLRNLIEVAGLPPTERFNHSDELRATVSCGVASASPLQGGHAQSLLDMADQALYQAKAKGRNLVWSTTELSRELALAGKEHAAF